MHCKIQVPFISFIYISTVSCLRRVFCDGDDTPDATPDSVKTHELNITPAICASTSFTTRDAKASEPHSGKRTLKPFHIKMQNLLV